MHVLVYPCVVSEAWSKAENNLLPWSKTYLFQKQSLNYIKKIFQLVLAGGSKQGCPTNFHWRLGKTPCRPSSARCVLGRWYSIQAWDGNKDFKIQPLRRWAGASHRAGKACLLAAARARSSGELVLQPKGCESAACRTGTLCISLQFPPFYSYGSSCCFKS